MAWLELDLDHGNNHTQESNMDKNLGVCQLLVLIFRAYLSPLIFVHGICGNVLSFLIFLRLHRRAPSRFNLYLIAISWSFILLLVFDTFLDDFLGRGLGWLMHHRVTLKLDLLSPLSCKTLTYVTDCTSFIALTTMTVFSLDRVCTLCFPLRFRGDRHLGCITTIITGVAVFGLVLFSPTFFFYDIQKSSITNQTACTLTNPSQAGAKFTLLIQVLASYTLPTVTMFVCNVVICFELVAMRRRQRKLRGDVSGRADVCRIVGHLTIDTAFLFLMIPLVVVIFLRYESTMRSALFSVQYQTRLIHLSRFFSSLLSVHFSSSFWVYIAFLPNFRDMTIELLLASPTIAVSWCGPCLYRQMTVHGACRLRRKSTVFEVNY